MSEFVISADVGKLTDYTAIVILEKIPHMMRKFHSSTGHQYAGVEEYSRGLWFGDMYEVPSGEYDFNLIHIERPSLGTTYPAIVNRLRELNDDYTALPGDKELIVDTTGVGEPFFDMLKAAYFTHKLYGITIHGGSEERRDGNKYYVPKRNLVSALSIANQTGKLQIAENIPLADVFLQEVGNFQCRISDSVRISTKMKIRICGKYGA